MKKVCYNIEIGHRGAEMYYVPVNKYTLRFWKFMWNPYLERYAFDHDGDGRKEIREYLNEQLRTGEVFDEKTDFASEWDEMGINAEHSFYGCPDFVIMRGTREKSQHGHMIFSEDKEIFGTRYLQTLREDGDEYNGVKWDDFFSNNVLANTKDFDVDQFKDEDGNYFVIELYRDEKGSFGEYFIEVDEGTFDLNKLQINRTRMLNGDCYVDSVFYDGKEIEVDTDGCGGDGKGDYHNFHSNVDGYGSDSSNDSDYDDDDDEDDEDGWDDDGEWED